LEAGGAMCFIFTFVALLASFVAAIMVTLSVFNKPVPSVHPILSLNNFVLVSLITGTVGWLLWLIIAQSELDDENVDADPASSFGLSVVACFFMLVAYIILKGFGSGAAAAPAS
jgi:hypothetical protein